MASKFKWQGSGSETKAGNGFIHSSFLHMTPLDFQTGQKNSFKRELTKTGALIYSNSKAFNGHVVCQEMSACLFWSSLIIIAHITTQCILGLVSGYLFVITP